MHWLRTLNWESAFRVVPLEFLNLRFIHNSARTSLGHNGTAQKERGRESTLSPGGMIADPYTNLSMADCPRGASERRRSTAQTHANAHLTGRGWTTRKDVDCAAMERFGLTLLHAVLGATVAQRTE